MTQEIITKNGTTVVAFHSQQPLITDVSSGLELVMTALHETGCANIAINKEAVTEDFFVLSTCFAGEILQKFINYGIRFAVYGDFSQYTGKALRDFMYESNKGNSVFFSQDLDEATEKLTAAK